MEALMLLAGGFFLFIVVLIYDAWATGFVLFKFYYWFLLPAFKELPHLSLSECIGIMMAVSIFKSMTPTYHLNGQEIKTKVDWVPTIIHPWIILGIGYMIKLILL